MSSIRGTRVVLRPSVESDYELFYVWMNDPEIAWWMDYEAPFSREEIAADIERSRREGVPLTITLEGEPIGRIGLYRLRERDKTAAAYMFIGNRKHRGQGLGKDAMLALLNYEFRFRGTRIVELWALSENKAAIHMYSSCGFREDGRLRERSWKAGEYMDHVWMSVTRPEFEAVAAGLDLPTPENPDADGA